MTEQDNPKADIYKVGDASCNLSPFTEKGFENEKLKWVTHLFVPEAKRKQGLAKALLSQLGKDADAIQTALILQVKPLEQNITQDQLEALYKRHGFVSIQDEPKLMMRTPVPPMLFEKIKQKQSSKIIQSIYR